MRVTFLISALLSIIYVIVTMRVNKSINKCLIPPSLSENFYLWEEKRKDLGWMFFGWCVGIGISVMAMMFTLSDGKWFQFVPFFAGIGLIMVGIAPRFKEHDKAMHQSGAFLCAASSIIWVVLVGFWYIMAIGLVLAFVVSIFDKRNYIFWFEMGDFGSTYLTLGLMI